MSQQKQPHAEEAQFDPLQPPSKRELIPQPFNEQEWEALLGSLPRRHLRRDPTASKTREQWPKLRVRKTDTPPEVTSRSHDKRGETPNSRQITPTSSAGSSIREATTRHSASTSQSAGQKNEQQNRRRASPLGALAPQVERSSTEGEDVMTRGQISPTTLQQQSKKLPDGELVNTSSSASKRPSLPRTGGLQSLSPLRDAYSSGYEELASGYGSSWWPVHEKALQYQREGVTESAPSANQGVAKNRLHNVSTETSSHVRPNPRKKTIGDAKQDATIFKLSMNPALVNKTSITHLKMHYGLPDEVARSLKKTAKKELDRRAEIAVQKYKQHEEKLREESALWEERMAKTREMDAVKKEQRFKQLMDTVDEGRGVLDDIKDDVLKKEASKEYEQTRALHDQWKTAVHDKVRKAISKHYEGGALEQRRRRRRKHYSNYLKAFGHENLSNYNPFAAQEAPIAVGYVEDPVQSGLMKGEKEERELYNEANTEEERLRQEAIQKLFFDHIPKGERQQSTSKGGGGLKKMKGKKDSPSKTDAMDLVDRVRMAEKEDASDRRWTLPPLLWSSGVINDTTYVRQYKTLDEFTASKEDIETLVTTEEIEADKQRTKCVEL